MHAKLFCKTGQLSGTTFRIEEQASIGKGPENTIALDPSQISRKHARVFYDSASLSYMIEDLDSRNGTRVDGVSVRGKQKLEKLNVITFANAYDFIFQIVEGEKPAAAERADAIAQEKAVRSSPKTVVSDESVAVPALEKGRSPQNTLDDQPVPAPSLQKEQKGLPDAPGRKTVIGDDFVSVPNIAEVGSPKSGPGSGAPQSNTVVDDGVILPPSISVAKEQLPHQQMLDASLWLEIETTPGVKKTFRLKDGENIIGRTQPCDIIIDDASMSRRHAVIVVKGGVATLNDLGSKNHTIFDNQRVTHETELRHGEPIVFGLVKATFTRKDPAKEK